VEELPPDEEGRRAGKDDDRDPEVEPLAGEVVRRIDAEQLFERTAEAVHGHVQGEERGRLDPEPPADQDQDARHPQVVDELVEERRVERVRGDVLRRPVPLIDLEPPGQIGRLAEELLVEPVAQASDSLGDEQAGRDRIGEEPDALTRPPDHEGSGQAPEQDPAPNAEPSFPDGERAPPLVGHLVPARDVVVRARSDDAERDPPDGDADDQIPVPAEPHPAQPGQPEGGCDREQQHQAVQVDVERPEVDDAGAR
jgi:hypothetical protein